VNRDSLYPLPNNPHRQRVHLTWQFQVRQIRRKRQGSDFSRGNFIDSFRPLGAPDVIPFAVFSRRESLAWIASEQGLRESRYSFRRLVPLNAAGSGMPLGSPRQPTNAVSMFHALQLKFVSDRIASYAMQEADAMVLVNVMRIPCFGRRMTIGRASISWPGAS
jgi:hypothetical protein